MEAVLTSTHNLCFKQKYEKYQNFLSENFHFLVVKFSVYLNRHVFIMKMKGSKEMKSSLQVRFKPRDIMIQSHLVHYENTPIQIYWNFTTKK